MYLKYSTSCEFHKILFSICASVYVSFHLKRHNQSLPSKYCNALPHTKRLKMLFRGFPYAFHVFLHCVFYHIEKVYKKFSSRGYSRIASSNKTDEETVIFQRKQCTIDQLLECQTLFHQDIAGLNLVKVIWSFFLHTH